MSENKSPRKLIDVLNDVKSGDLTADEASVEIQALSPVDDTKPPRPTNP